MGGNRGPAAEPGKPDHSRLFQALAFTGDLKMPPTGKLKPEDIASFNAGWRQDSLGRKTKRPEIRSRLLRRIGRFNPSNSLPSPC